MVISVYHSLMTPTAQARVNPQVKPYKVAADLNNIANLDSFKTAVEQSTRKEFSLSGAQKEKLIQNAFVVAPADAEQFFHIYESRHYGMKPRIPNFITSDCVLHLYHLLYDFSLRAIEVEDLLPAIRELTQAMLAGSIEQYENASDPALKDACQKNICFFGVAARLMLLPEIALPADCLPDIEAELQKIEEHSRRASSSIFPFLHDYSQYITRGHYTRSEELSRFFQAMMWYGQNAFPFKFNGRRTEQQILQALLITHLLQNSRADDEPLIKLWDRVYSITALYVGSTDDLNVHQFYELMQEVYGEEVSLESLADRKNLDLFYEKSDQLPKPRIVTQMVGIPSGLQFRFMGQRFIPDSYMMQKLVSWPQRPWPMGLDVMAVLGSDRAFTLLNDVYKEPQKWSGYLPQMEKLKGEFSAMTEEEWYQNLFHGWLYVLKTLVEERGEGYPSFMRNLAWSDKELNAALASWAELRHDTILYGKPSGAEGGDGFGEKWQPKGYVEPIPDFYAELLKLVQLNVKILEDFGIGAEVDSVQQEEFPPSKPGMRPGRRPPSPVRRIRLPKSPGGYNYGTVMYACDKYADLLAFLEGVARKELAGEALTYEEYERIRNFGAEIENLSLRLVELDKNLPTLDWRTGEKITGRPIHLRGWYEVTGPDRDIAVIADIHTSGSDCLEEAVGHINIIYVVVPIEGELHLTRGGIFSYYEFQYPADHRLTDEAWQEMIKRGRAPDPPVWTSSFVAK